MAANTITLAQLREQVGAEIAVDRRGRVKTPLVDYKAMLEAQMQLAGLPEPTREFAFAAHLKRRFRFDWCWGGRLIAVEYEGGTFQGKSRHTTVSGFNRDTEKYSLAAELGWRVFRYTSDQVRSGQAVAQIERVFAQSGRA